MPTNNYPVKSDPESVNALIDKFARTTDDIITLEEFKTKLLSGRQLVFKYGVDLTAEYLHLGHAVNLWMYRDLQLLGHKIIFLLGDFTTRIGDPTGKSKTRPVLTEEKIHENAEAIKEQALQVLIDDPQVLEVRRNSEWLDAMSTTQLLSIMSTVTVEHLLSRDMFRKRMAEGASIASHEFIYPILQGWDSVALHADGTVIGTDQLFNEMMGRTLQAREGQEPQIVITSKITPGIDGGEKQSKSLGNYVGIGHSPRDKFARLMKVPDRLLEEYLYVYSELSKQEIDAILAKQEDSPMEAKLDMAEAIVTRWHGEEVSQTERAWFNSTFRQKETPADIPSLVIPESCTAMEALKLIDSSQSNSSIRRLISGGGVKLDGKAIASHEDVLIKGSILKVGKHRWFKLI